MGLCLIYDIALVFSFETIYPNTCKIDLVCEIITLKEEGEYNNKYLVKVIFNENVKRKNTKVIIYTKLDKNYIPGDIIKIKGDFKKAEKARNYKGFDYNNYLKQNKIYGIIYAQDTKKINMKHDVYFIRGKILKKAFNILNNIYDEEKIGFLEGILFGYTKNIIKNLKDNFEVANVSHILAISGLHLSYLIFSISFILKKTLKNKKVENIILIIFLFVFLFIIDGKASSIRAVIMSTISIMSFYFHKKYNFNRSIIFSFLIILIINPFNIFNIGMWLSFLGIFGIHTFYNFFKMIINHYFKNSKIIESLTLSFSVQIMIFPIIVYNFNIISLCFFISNIVVAVLIDKIIILGYLSIFLSLINVNLSLFVSKLNGVLIKIFFVLIENIAKIPLSKIIVKTPYFISIFLYYLILFVIIIFFAKYKYYCLRLICSHDFVIIQIKWLILKLKKKKFLITIIILISLVFFIIISFNNSLNIYFLDVGQGDCTVIQTPNRKNILIDGGNNGKYDYGENVVFPYLLDRRIDQIDYMIISHFDSDHIRWTFLYNRKYESEKDNNR